MIQIHIGIDDVDSISGGCTTHFATYLLKFLSDKYKLKLLDYPRLVRLNPGIPIKTRGNGGVAIHLLLEEPLRINNFVDDVEYFTKQYIDTFGGPDQDPGIVICIGSIPYEFAKIYDMAISDVVHRDVVLELITKINNVVLTKFCGWGLVGAVAALGWWHRAHEYTFELLTYRSIRFISKPRCVDPDSVKQFEALFNEYTFCNLDEEGNPIISPHGSDPVLYGVRGTNPNVLLRAIDIIKTCEPIAAWCLYRTNQGTDSHAVPRLCKDLRPYQSAKLTLRIASTPITITGGHVIVRGCDVSGCIDLAFFRPSRLTTVARNLCIGDLVDVQGVVKHWINKLVLHVEKIVVVKKNVLRSISSPSCPLCNSKMKKLGRGKGYRCTSCGFVTLKRSLTSLPSHIKEGLYIPPSKSIKHLVKPLKLYQLPHHEVPPRILDIDEVLHVNEPLQFL